MSDFAGNAGLQYAGMRGFARGLRRNLERVERLFGALRRGRANADLYGYDSGGEWRGGLPGLPGSAVLQY